MGRMCVAMRGPDPIRTLMPTPCWTCRPEASMFTPEAKLKNEDGRKAALAAMRRGA
jgi:hypothetical protein